MSGELVSEIFKNGDGCPMSGATSNLFAFNPSFRENDQKSFAAGGQDWERLSTMCGLVDTNGTGILLVGLG